MRLTDAAIVLAEHAERLLAGAERAEADLAAAAAGAVAGVVRVGSFQTASLRLLLPAMNALRESHPGVRVRLVEAEPEPALEALRSHALDLVLADEWAGTPHPRWPGLDREDLFTEPRPRRAAERPSAGGGRARSRSAPSPARRGRPATRAAAWRRSSAASATSTAASSPTSATRRTS